jgi:hypothetical protein
MVCFAEVLYVYENQAKSILGLPRSEGNKRNRRALPILILCRKNISISVNFMNFIGDLQTGYRPGTGIKLLEMELNF